MVKGRVHGIDLHFIDTPGLHVSAAGQARNYAVLRQIRGAFRSHKPDLVVWAARAAAGAACLPARARPGLAAA
jgi:hypothetical protein